jgi:hypothetical protein
MAMNVAKIISHNDPHMNQYWKRMVRSYAVSTPISALVTHNLHLGVVT